MDGTDQDGGTGAAAAVGLICPVCASEVMVPYAEICPWHSLAIDDGWAVGNRQACDFLHRGVEPPEVVEDPATYPLIYP